MLHNHAVGLIKSSEFGETPIKLGQYRAIIQKEEVEMFICRICSREFKSAKSLSRHLRVHNITSKEYRKNFEDYRKLPTDDSLITCPICNKNNLKCLPHHVRKSHGMSKSEFCELYPDQKLYAECYMKKVKALQSRRAIYGHQELKKDPERYEKWLSETNNLPEFTEEERSANTSKRNKTMWKDPEYREKMTKVLIENAKNSKPSGFKKFEYTTKQGITVFARSTWEMELLKYYDNNDVNFIFEGLQVPYYDSIMKRHRRYFPDFYLPDKNLIVEVKPKYQLSHINVIDKYNACIEQGYNFKFFTEDDFKELGIVV